MNETVFEMHFHNAMMELIRSTLGLGQGRFNFYKYSPQKESFVGFDQAYIRTDLNEQELFNQLKNDAINNGYNLSNFFIGLFLQYKVVKKMQKRTRTTPSGITANPYFRVSVDTQKNDRTGFSQHELLYNLNRNNSVIVCYACPMIFEREQLYIQPADLSKLCMANLNSCPSDYSDNESHYIFFNSTTSNPVWCSDPTEGEALSPLQLSQKILDGLFDGRIKDNQIALLDKLLSYPDDRSATIAQSTQDGRLRFLDMLHDSLILLRYQSQEVAS